MFRKAIQQGQELFARMGILAIQQQQTRNTIVVRRMYPPPTREKPERRLRKREYVYIQEQNDNTVPFGNMEVLLTKDVDGIGGKGELVNIPKSIARNQLLPLGVAVYNSPENQKKYASEEKEKPENEIPYWTEKTIRQLESMTLPIPMNPQVEWTLTPRHVRLAFRRKGVVLPEDAIKMPEQPITQPQEFTLQIMINKVHPVEIQALIYDYDPENTDVKLPKLWKKTRRTMQDALQDIIEKEKQQ